jgi:hypothetical protein
LDAAAGGDPRAAADLLPLVYAELRKLAAAWLGVREAVEGLRQKGGQTLSPLRRPQEGELIPRCGAWPAATKADRAWSLVGLTGCWCFGASIAFGMMRRLAQVIYDVAFAPNGGCEKGPNAAADWS